MGLEFWLTLIFLGLRTDLFQTITLLTAARVALVLPVLAGAGTLEAGLVLAASPGIFPCRRSWCQPAHPGQGQVFFRSGLFLSTAFTRPGSIKPLPNNIADVYAYREISDKRAAASGEPVFNLYSYFKEKSDEHKTGQCTV